MPSPVTNGENLYTRAGRVVIATSTVDCSCCELSSCSVCDGGDSSANVLLDVWDVKSDHTCCTTYNGAYLLPRFLTDATCRGNTQCRWSTTNSNVPTDCGVDFKYPRFEFVNVGVVKRTTTWAIIASLVTYGAAFNARDELRFVWEDVFAPNCVDGSYTLAFQSPYDLSYACIQPGAVPFCDVSTAYAEVTFVP